MIRALVAFAACTLALPTYVAATGGTGSLSGAIFFFLPFTVAGCLLFGVPTYLFFIWRGWRRLWQFILGGATLGALCAAPFIGDGILQALRWAVLFSAYGSAHAAVFWLIALWRSTSSLTSRSTGTSRATHMPPVN